VTTAYVVDASVAVKWFVPENGSEQADKLSGAGASLFAPKLILAEVANAFCKKVRRGLMTEADAHEHLSALPRYFDLLLEGEPFLALALSLAIAFDHPVYDFVYLEIARRHQATLLTADERFARKLSSTPHASLVAELSAWSSDVR
jgi:predicted nucleic acid-binding protein